MPPPQKRSPRLRCVSRHSDLYDLNPNVSLVDKGQRPCSTCSGLYLRFFEGAIVLIGPILDVHVRLGEGKVSRH